MGLGYGALFLDSTPLPTHVQVLERQTKALAQALAGACGAWGLGFRV